jgi:hypothetical protein
MLRRTRWVRQNDFSISMPNEANMETEEHLIEVTSHPRLTAALQMRLPNSCQLPLLVIQESNITQKAIATANYQLLLKRLGHNVNFLVVVVAFCDQT